MQKAKPNLGLPHPEKLGWDHYCHDITPQTLTYARLLLTP
jgi:hypothetical protein